MTKITFTDSDLLKFYRSEIKKRYNAMREEGEYFNYFHNPTNTKLREMSGMLLSTKKLNATDTDIFQKFFDESKTKDLRIAIEQYPIGGLKASESFFKKEKHNLQDIAALDLLAVLTNYEPRPFFKFKKIYPFEEVVSEPLKEEITLLANRPAVTIPTKELVMEGEDEVAPIEEREVEDNEVLAISEIEKENEKPLEEAKNKFSEITSLISDLNDNDDGNNEEKKADKINVAQDRLGLTTEISPPVATDKGDEAEKIAEGNRARKLIYAITALVFMIAIGVAVKIQFFPYYDHMQWSGTQYVLAPMDSTNTTNIERDDKMLRDFKRIYPTRKQVLFDKEDKGLIWYSRIKNDTYEFFSSEGPMQHPVTKHEIKRITRSIARDHIPLE